MTVPRALGLQLYLLRRWNWGGFTGSRYLKRRYDWSTRVGLLLASSTGGLFGTEVSSMCRRTP